MESHNASASFHVLVSREEIQVRFGIPAAKMAALLNDPTSGIPAIYFTSIPQFEVGAFLRWSIAKYGRGDWGETAKAGGLEPVKRSGRVVPRRNPLPK